MPDNPRLTAERFYFRAIDATLFVHDRVTETAHLLNAAAGRLFLCLTPDFVGPAALAAQSSAEVEADWRGCLADWTRLGWIEADDLGRVRLRAASRKEHADDMVIAGRPERLVGQCRVRLNGRSANVRLLVQDGVAEDATGGHGPDRSGREGPFREVAARLAGGRRVLAFLGGFAEPAPESDPPEASLDMVVAGHGWIVRCGPRTLHTTDDAVAAGKMRLWLLDFAYDAGRPAILLHAAALGLPGGAVVLAGISGAGKSTLSAALVARGWRLGTDDSLALAFEEGHAVVLPCPGAISLKAGSLAPLATLYPDLAALPLVGAGAKQGRYLAVPPERHLPARGSANRVRCFVFPSFEAGTPTRVTPLSASQALAALMDAAFDIAEQAGAAEFDAFFDALEAAPRFAVTYGELDDMEATLRALLGGASRRVS